MLRQSIQHKRSATFSYSGLVKLPTGTWSAESEIRDSKDALVQNLAVTLSVLGSPGANGETHSILIEASATETAAWPLNEKLKCDIVFKIGAVVVPSETFNIVVVQGVTIAG